MEQQQPNHNNYYPHNQVTLDSQGYPVHHNNTAPSHDHVPPSQDSLAINKITDFTHTAPMGEMANNASYRQESAPHLYNANNPQVHNTAPNANASTIASPQEVFPPNPYTPPHPHSQSHYEQYVKNHSIYPHSAPSTPQHGYSEGGMGTPHNNPSKKETKKQTISNEKFIIAALLTSIVITSVIIGLGWSLFTPKSSTSDVIAHTSDSDTLASTPLDATTPTPSQDLVIVYGTTNTQKDESSNLSQNQENSSPPVSSRTTPTKSVAQKNSPAVAASAPSPVNAMPKTASIPSTPVAAQTPTRSSMTSTVTPKVTSPNTNTISNNATQYWIQIFSTTNKDKALQIQKSFSGQGITPTIVTKTINNTLYYRLRIGPYFNKAESGKFLSWVKTNASYKDAYVSTIKR